jgi:hypothetical protein
LKESGSGFVWVNRGSPVVESFFSDIELKLELLGGSVIASAGAIEQSVGEESSLAIRVSWHVVDVKAKNMRSIFCVVCE